MKIRFLTTAIVYALPLSLAACAGEDPSSEAAFAQSGAVAQDCAERTGGAYVTFEVGGEGNPDGELFTGWFTDPTFIADAKWHLENNERGTPNMAFVDGGDCADDKWSFHVDPKDAQVAWGSIEVCDAMPSYVNDNRDEWITKELRWCPWGVRFVSVDEK
jgi:hypothetical protein